MTDTQASTQTPAQADNSYLDNIAVPTPPAGGPKTGGGGSVMITNPVDGTQVSRSTYIKALAKAGWSRRQIQDHLKEIGHEVRYQTVYQATQEFFPKRGEEGYNEAEDDADESADE